MENILVVENDEEILSNLKLMLETEGYIVQTAINGMEALKKIEYMMPNLIIIDMKMPYMDGLELKTRIMAKNNPSPIIFMIDRVDLENYPKEDLINDIITKPYVIDELLNMIRRRLEKNRNNKLLIDEKTGRYIAHRLRSPLTPLLSFLEFMIEEEKNNLDIKKNDILERVMMSANILYNSVETFLFFYEKRLYPLKNIIEPLKFDKNIFENISKHYYELKLLYKEISLFIEPAILIIDSIGMERLLTEVFHVMHTYFEHNSEICVDGNIFNAAYLLTINAKKNPFYKNNVKNIEILKQYETEMNVQDLGTIEKIIEMYGGKINIEEEKNRILVIKLFFQIL